MAILFGKSDSHSGYCGVWIEIHECLLSIALNSSVASSVVLKHEESCITSVSTILKMIIKSLRTGKTMCRYLMYSVDDRRLFPPVFRSWPAPLFSLANSLACATSRPGQALIAWRSALALKCWL